MRMSNPASLTSPKLFSSIEMGDWEKGWEDLDLYL
jgi:hypothetical protein